MVELRSQNAKAFYSAVLVASGQIGGFILALSLIGGALWLALKDKPIEAFIGLASGISLLYWGYSGKGEKAGSKDKKESANPPKKG